MRRTTSNRRTNRSKIVTGLILAAVGLLFWLDRIDVLEASDFVDYWPLIPIAIGLSHLLGGAIIGGLLWIVVGALFLGSTLDLLELDPRWLFDLWPLVLVFIGLILIRQALGATQKDASADPLQTFAMSAIMAGHVRTNNSQAFLGGDVTAIMGGCEIDLRSARIEDGEAVIDALAFWGGIEIHVPPDWEVVSRVTPLLGSFENRTLLPSQPGQRLVIRGTAVMGGIEVTN